MKPKRKIKQKRTVAAHRIPAWLFFVTWVVMTGILFHASVLISNGLDYYLARAGIPLSVSAYLPNMLIPFGLMSAVQAFLLHLYAGWSAWRWLLFSSAGLLVASLVEGVLSPVQSYLYGADIYRLSSTAIYALALLTLTGFQARVMRDKVRRAWLWPLFVCGSFLAADRVYSLIVSYEMSYGQAAEIIAYTLFAALTGAGMWYLLHYQQRVVSADHRVLE